MHSRVFELSHKPIAAGERMTVAALPEWFMLSACDYAVPSEQRDRDIDWLTDCFHGLCSRDGDKLTFAPDVKERYFRKNYETFKKAAAELAKTDYDVFAGMRECTAFHIARFDVDESYEGRYGFYVYSPESRELQPLDAWLRGADTGKPFYVGGTVDYHC